MKFVLLSVLVSIVVLNEIHCTLKGDWNKFKADYNKSYGNKKEERLRFRNFKTNIKDIRKHNRSFKRNLETFEKGINEFTDLTAHEFKLRYGLFESKNIEIYKSSYKPNISTSVNSSNPEYFDWREKGAVTPAKDQGHCGSCWIYSAIGTLESYYFRKFGKLVTLSEQNVVDCFPDATCLGGLPERAFSFVKKHGINSDSDYPFHEKQGQCNPIKSKYINITYNKLERISGSEEIMKNALIRHGPFEICMYVTKKWRFYKSGVWYDKECSNDTNHSMMLVGFGTEDGHDYWLIKNSWGRTWGQDGFIKVMRNKHDNFCGITNESLYLI